MMTIRNILILAVLGTFPALAESAEEKPVIAIIGTGDMGDSLGPRFAELGYEVIFGSRHPDGEVEPCCRRRRPGRGTGDSRGSPGVPGDSLVEAVPAA
jgi:predicted dinucleotide-binding enzyme